MLELLDWLLTRVGLQLPLAALVAARVAPLTVVAPWLSLKRTPPVLRSTLVIGLTVALYPMTAAGAPEELPEGAVYFAWLVREVAVGSAYAFATALPFFAFDWAGRLVDTWRGASLAQVIAPNTGERTSPLGNLYLLLAITFFVTLGGHRLAIEAFAIGLRDFPVATSSASVAELQTFALSAAQLTGSALALSLSIAAPAAAAIVLVELSLGLLARSAPQVPVFFAGMPLRAATGLAAMLLALSATMRLMPEVFRDALTIAEQWMSVL